MATAIASRQCSKCKDNIGSFNCEGCKEIFCTKHSMEHRQELCNRFEQLMSELNVILQQTYDKEQQNESLKKGVFCRIDEWENNMVEKARERAEQVRQRFDELINNKNKTIVNHIQPLTDETRRRYEKEDFLEHDIERIKQNINQAQQAIEQSDIELCIESNHRIDWNHLIYIKEKSNTPSFSVTNKQSTDKDNKGTQSTMNSNLIRHPFTYNPSFYSPPPPLWYCPPTIRPSYVPIIRPPIEYGSIANFPPHAHQPPHQAASIPYSTPDKRPRKPLCIIDPVSHIAVESATSSSFVDTNHISSEVTPVDDTSSPSTFNLSTTADKDKKNEEFRRQFARQLSPSSNT